MLTRDKIESIRRECEEQVEGPGKFEGESIYVPYFYGDSLDGCADGFGDVDWIGYYSAVSVDDDDRAIFPELEGVETVYLCETGQGFVSEITRENYEDAETDWEVFGSDEDEDDDAWGGEDDSNEDDKPSEPEEGDLVTEDDRVYRIYGSSKLAVLVTDEQVEDGTDIDAIREYMDREGFYPNVWQLSDHGNYHLRSLEKKS